MADNARAMTRDETRYPGAEDFNPSRWIDPAFPTYREPLAQYPNLTGYSQFGFGRRTCQGVPIVEQDLFLAMGSLAWAFDIRKKRDPLTGAEVAVHRNNYTPLLIAKPARFPFDAVPRSPEKVTSMREMFETALDKPGTRGGGEDMDISQFENDLGDLVHFDHITVAESTSSVEDAGLASGVSMSSSSTSLSEASRANMEREERELPPGSWKSQSVEARGGEASGSVGKATAAPAVESF